MSDLIPSSVLLALIDNKIPSLKDDFSDVAKGKRVEDTSALTEEEKSDIAKNKYDYIFDDSYCFWKTFNTGINWLYSSFEVTGCNILRNGEYSFPQLYRINDISDDDEDIYDAVSNVYYLAAMVSYASHFFFRATYDLPNEQRYATLCSIPELQHDNTGAVKVYKLHTDAETREFKLEDYDLKCNYRVVTDATGAVTSTPLRFSEADALLPDPASVTLTTAKYPDVVFYSNYHNNSTDSIIYRFSSGIILDSSTETPQYKIVFASYNVKTAKVTFVEKVLP